MSRKRVLFYLEPVTFADSPFRLQAWWNFFSAFAAKSTANFICEAAASPAIGSLGSSDFAKVHDINQIELLRSTDFDRVAYSRDLCSGYDYRNRYLLDNLDRINRSFSPDIVVTFTDNRYLSRIFGTGNVIFTELGPLPRTGMAPSIYFDPFGHQTNSALSWFARSKWEHPSLADFWEMWSSAWVDPVRAAAASSGIASWMQDAVAGSEKKIMLAALQPRDWITYEGIGPAIDPIAILRRLADDVGGEWAIVPQWHGSDVPPSDDIIHELTACQPNILSPPAEFRVANSEKLLPFIDAVATISSNVAAVGAILGKELRIMGNSKFRMIGESQRDGLARPDILAFLCCRYCARLDDMLNVEGAFAERILRLVHSPEALFDPSDIDVAQLASFFQIAA